MRVRYKDIIITCDTAVLLENQRKIIFTTRDSEIYASEFDSWVEAREAHKALLISGYIDVHNLVESKYTGLIANAICKD